MLIVKKIYVDLHREGYKNRVETFTVELMELELPKQIFTFMANLHT
jgi:hypothetical protein